ncbi:MAG TPA: cyclase family protein [Terriglobales bacterium]|nr:cyclase family protein [Terriglobales bacterium]
MKIYDISLALSAQTVRWVTAPPFELIERKRMARGDSNNSSALHASVHAGTHIDAPFHFVSDGVTIEALPVDLFMGPARVCVLETAKKITASDVQQLGLTGEKRVLFKTGNSGLLHQAAYDPGFVSFSADAASALADLGLQLVGLDYLSVAAADQQVAVHRAFLDRGVVLLEGVDLSEVPPGHYELICLPIKIERSDGAPCRAVLRELLS